MVTEANEWTGRVGSAWAQEWRRTDRSFGALTDRLLDPAALGAFSRVLDIGCGAGEVSLRIAEGNPRAEVLGIDISPELLAIARERAKDSVNVRFAAADGTTWAAAPGTEPDLLVSRHGVMFFADPISAFAQLRGQSARGACLRFSCFRVRADNGWAVALASVLPPQPPVDPDAPGPFAFGDAARVESILAAAGWRGVTFEPVDYAMIGGEGDADGYGALDEALAYFQRIGPAARALSVMPPSDREAAYARLRAMLADHCEGGRVSFPAAAWIVTAQAP